MSDASSNNGTKPTAPPVTGLYRDPKDLIQWAYDLMGTKLMMSTAFGKSGMCIMHMVQELKLDIPIYFLDTGFHFKESLEFVETLRSRWTVNLRIKRPELFGEAFNAEYGENLNETDPDLCCHKNKVEPFSDLIKEYQGWITGIRRDQSSTRSQAEPLEPIEGGQLKVQPLVYWTRNEVDEYLNKHKIPLHPLFAHGYTSIGCAPCTRPATDDGDERSGRWAGKAKTECGLHTFWKNKKKQARSESSEVATTGEVGAQTAG